MGRCSWPGSGGELNLPALLERLGLEAPPARNFEGLRALYRAWCFGIPFDNVRKMIALRTHAGLPGRDASEFLGAWLETGAGGTCWPGSNALYELANALGFDARRAAGSMYDDGDVNHGSTIVVLDSDWLIDSSMLTREPIPLAGLFHDRFDGAAEVEVEPVEGGHIVWTTPLHQSRPIPCRIFHRPVGYEETLEKYEASRSRSPFNQRLCARRERPERAVLLRGSTRFERTAKGVVQTQLTPSDLCAALREEIGLSAALVDAWVGCGGLADSFEPPSHEPPRVVGLPPSQRSRAESHSVMRRL